MVLEVRRGLGRGPIDPRGKALDAVAADPERSALAAHAPVRRASAEGDPPLARHVSARGRLARRATLEDQPKQRVRPFTCRRGDRDDLNVTRGELRRKRPDRRAGVGQVDLVQRDDPRPLDETVPVARELGVDRRYVREGVGLRRVDDVHEEAGPLHVT